MDRTQQQGTCADRAGEAFDPRTFIQQPHTVLRLVSWLFSLVIFSCIANEGYINRPDEGQQFCIFNRNQNACNYAVAMGSLAFVCCMAFLALDACFPQIPSIKGRKKAVLVDMGTSAFWSFAWFVGFCFLANQWQVSKVEDKSLQSGGDAARAAITFSFFSIFSWAGLTLLSLQRLRSVCFQQEYEELFTQQNTRTPSQCVGQAMLAFQRFKLSQEFTDPNEDVAVVPYTALEQQGPTRTPVSGRSTEPSMTDSDQH